MKDSRGLRQVLNDDKPNKEFAFKQIEKFAGMP